jgi:hypothetical protein
MISGWGYQVAPSLFAASQCVNDANPRAPPLRGAPSARIPTPEHAKGPAEAPPAQANHDPTPNDNGKEESRYVSPYIHLPIMQ